MIDKKLNLNQVSQEDLAQIPGVSSVAAQYIIEYRARFGEFTNLDELDQIEGIRPELVSDLKKHLTLWNLIFRKKGPPKCTVRYARAEMAGRPG